MPRTRRSAVLFMLPLLVTLFPARSLVSAQQGDGTPLKDPRSPIVHRTDLYCAGFISKKKVASEFYIIGGEREDELRWFTTANIVYLNYGQKDGASVGESLYVIRPRGEYENPFTGKDVGYYHEELGIIRILAVQKNQSIAEVSATCGGMRIGDRVRSYDQFIAPTPREYQPLNRYDLPSGKLSGQIILSRDFRDYMSERDIVYLDIGDKQGVKLGQYYTVYHKPGEIEGPVGPDHPWLREDDDTWSRDSGFQDFRFKNGDFSILRGKPNSDKVVIERKGVPRKVVGEIVIIRVEDHSATGVITRVTQEVSVGDYVEMQ